MTQAQLDRSVARLTGESVDFIHQFGFSEMHVRPAPHRTRKASRLTVRARRGCWRPHAPVRMAA